MSSTHEIEHFTTLDRSILENDDAYANYFRQVSELFSLIRQAINEKSTDEPFEVKIIHDYLQQYLFTLQLLRTKFLYNEEQRMKVDLTESSFPNYLEIKQIESDLEQREDLLKGLPEEAVLRQSIVDFIFKNKAVPKKLLKQLAKRKYLEMLGKETPFSSYNSGKYRQLSKKNEQPTYLYHWAVFDSKTNRPFIYFLLFDHEEVNRVPFKSEKLLITALTKYIEKSSAHQSPLRVMASDIDREFRTIHPKVLKRMDIGPLYGHLSLDKHPFTKLVKDQFSEKDWIVEFTTELLFSVGQKRTNGFLSTGELREVFFIDESNKECMERHVSKVLNYMIAPHGVVSFLREHHKASLERLAVPPFIYNPKTMKLYE